jgi:hypothetical protein
MSALIDDVIGERLPPIICNAAVSAGGKMLKAKEMALRYGASSATCSPLSLVETPKSRAKAA